MPVEKTLRCDNCSSDQMEVATADIVIHAEMQDEAVEGEIVMAGVIENGKFSGTITIDCMCFVPGVSDKFKCKKCGQASSFGELTLGLDGDEHTLERDEVVEVVSKKVTDILNRTLPVGGENK